MPEKIDEKNYTILQKCFIICVDIDKFIDKFRIKKEKKDFKYKLIKNTTTLVDYKIILN